MNVEMRNAQRLEIKDILCDILEIEPDEMTDTSLFKEDHDADSLRAIEILAALERKFDVVIPQDELGRLVSLDAVFEVVSEKANWS